MSLHHAMKSELISESLGKEETALVKYDDYIAKGVGNSFGGKQMKKAGMRDKPGARHVSFIDAVVSLVQKS